LWQKILNGAEIFDTAESENSKSLKKIFGIFLRKILTYKKYTKLMPDQVHLQVLALRNKKGKPPKVFSPFFINSEFLQTFLLKISYPRFLIPNSRIFKFPLFSDFSPFQKWTNPKIGFLAVFARNGHVFAT
jgi:hypothetical protein